MTITNKKSNPSIQDTSDLNMDGKVVLEKFNGKTCKDSPATHFWVKYRYVSKD